MTRGTWSASEPGAAALSADSAAILVPLSAALYLLAATLDLTLRDADSIIVLSPQHGVLLALLMVTRPERWWLIAAAVVPAHLAASWSTGLPLWQLAWQGAFSFILATGISTALRALLGERSPFDDLQDFSLYVLTAVVAGPALLTMLAPGVVLALLGGTVNLAIADWQAETIASSLAILTWGSWMYLGLLPQPGWLHQRSPAQYAEALLIAAALYGCFHLTFVSDAEHHAALYLLFIPLLWLSVRFGVRAAAMAVTLIATGAATLERIPHSVRIRDAPELATLDLQIFLMVMALSAVMIAIVVDERRRVARAASESDARYRAIVDSRTDDITALRRTELALRQNDELLRKNLAEANRTLERFARLAMVGQITASIAHEMNQPLGAIRYNTEAGLLFLSRERYDKDELQEIFDDIRRDNRRASELVSRLRELLHDHELRLDPVDLNDVIADVVKLLRVESRQRHVQLETQCTELPTVLGDYGRLQQVLLNLILNAMDAMSTLPEAHRRIAIRTTHTGAARIQVEVVDRGSGIDPATLPKIFDSFFTSKAQGMGLGLAIARSIVEAHGGRIWAKNNSDGAGATLSFEIDSLGSKAMLPADRTDRYGARLN
ncbi:ATP-binding protein [Steroidobacter cummioxidans]|uniref:ATP-binding protein n=1 Tax=Steroidobacter cummioxidans TaxID=1803913 RepID=UPI000E317418|nr:ATP-binding protein [Steroidobacter cummioxidans]